MIRLFPDTMARASTFGRYPSSSAADFTFAAVLAETDAPGV